MVSYPSNWLVFVSINHLVLRARQRGARDHSPLFSPSSPSREKNEGAGSLALMWQGKGSKPVTGFFDKFAGRVTLSRIGVRWCGKAERRVSEVVRMRRMRAEGVEGWRENPFSNPGVPEWL